MAREISIYLKLTKMHIRSGLEYRGWWMMVIYVTVGLAADLFAIVLMFLRFGGVGEWSMERILLVYMLASTSYGLAKIICVGLEDFPWEIQSGSLDRMLLRPCSLLLQIIGSRFRLRRVPWAITGVAAIIWLWVRLGIPFGFFNLVVLVFALLGGFLLYTGVFVMTSGIAFFTVKGLDWIYLLTSGARQVTRCPIDYLPKVLWGTFTFVMPVMVVSYYPAALVCGWGEPAFAGLLALPVGMLFFWISLFVWKIGLRHYKSTGS